MYYGEVTIVWVLFIRFRNIMATYHTNMHTYVPIFKRTATPIIFSGKTCPRIINYLFIAILEYRLLLESI